MKNLIYSILIISLLLFFSGQNKSQSIVGTPQQTSCRPLCTQLVVVDDLDIGNLPSALAMMIQPDTYYFQRNSGGRLTGERGIWGQHLQQSDVKRELANFPADEYLVFASTTNIHIITKEKPHNSVENFSTVDQSICVYNDGNHLIAVEVYR